MDIRKTIFVSFAILLVGGLAAWWYFGFTLDFTRFFAAEQGVTDTDSIGPFRSAPPGCYYKEIVCITTPCDPILVCPSCLPRPACLDATPSCRIAEPAEGWCPSEISGMVQCSPATQTVKVGAQATLSASSGAGPYTWYAPEGTSIGAGSGGTPSSARFSVSYTVPGTKKVTVQSPRLDIGLTIQPSRFIDSVACTVIVQ